MPRRTARYFVVIGDVIDSRSIPGESDRARFQEGLQWLFSEIGHDAELVSPFTITLGDEFQAVYRGAGGLFRHWFRIRSSIHPVRFRFSVACGRLDTEINPNQAIGMDGPAFHLARQGVERLKKREEILGIAGEEGMLPAITRPLVSLLAAETETWNANRLAIIHRMLAGLSEDHVVRDLQIPGLLEISESAVYKNIRAARLDQWTDLITEAECLLSRISR